MKLVIATNNSHKTEEFSRMLMPLGIEVISQKEAGVNVNPEENAETFLGNAYIKAKACADEVNYATLADDSGLEVKALNNEPGVHTARYGGEGLTDQERYMLLLKNMNNVKEEDREAHFCCALVLIMPDGEKFEFFETCEGKIGYEPRGLDGFGYDPIFMVGDKSFSELTPKEKDNVSHRGKALRKLYKTLEELKER